MWPVFLIQPKRPSKTQINMVWARPPMGWGKGITLAETQVPRHASPVTLYLYINKLENMKNIKVK
jgi:hypothetical protein